MRVMIFAKWCVFVAFLLVYVPRIFVARAQARVPGGYDNRMPREQQTKLDDAGKRAQAAHMNAFESFAPFAAAVLFATLAERRPDPSIVDGLAGAHVVCRAIYTGLYIGDKPTARSAVWSLGFAATCAIFVVTLVV